MRQRQQIREQPKRTGYCRWQLPEKTQAGVDVRALPYRCNQQSASEGSFTRIVRFQHRLVALIPATREVKSALLNPPLPVGIGQPVREAPCWMIGEEAHGCTFICDPVMTDLWSAHSQRIWSEASSEVPMLLILHDDETSAARILQKPSVVGHQRRIGFVGAWANHDCVEAGEIAALQSFGAQHYDRDANTRECLRNLVRRSADVPDSAQAR